MACLSCAHWTAGTKVPFSTPEMVATYGLCRPVFGLLPFWASRWQRDMQTNTQPHEGSPCAAFDGAAN